jgi:hypothetical protein
MHQDYHDHPMESLLNQATKDSQLWHDLLLTCNQSLELPKCGYHVLHHTFLPTGEPTVTELPPTNLTIQEKSGEPLKIQQWSNSNAAKYLGTHKCLANQKTQASKLLSKCNDFARNVNTSYLTRGETKQLYWSIDIQIKRQLRTSNVPLHFQRTQQNTEEITCFHGLQPRAATTNAQLQSFSMAHTTWEEPTSSTSTTIKDMAKSSCS